MNAPWANEPIRTLIVDDEPAARNGLRQLLGRDPSILIVGESSNGAAAVADIRALTPELLFLDVQMPELDGFGVVRQLRADQVPVTVFVTAHDRYALRAFEVHAIDYLLKPFSDARFRDTLAHAKEEVRKSKLTHVSRSLAALLAEFDSEGVAMAERPPRSSKAPGVYLDRLLVKSGDRSTLLRTDEVDWVDAERDYVRIHSGKACFRLRETMKRLEGRLDPAQFVRIHRSTIVNIDRVKEVRPFYGGDYVAALHDGNTLKISRGYRSQFEARIGRRI